MTTSWIADKVVWITGAASGLGAATAARLHQRGARLVLSDLDLAGVQRVARSLGPEVLALRADVTRPDELAQVVARAMQDHGRLDVVWANAGVASFGPVAITDPVAWVRNIEVNLMGVFHTVRAALPAVMQRRGHVAVTASAASFVHAPCMSAYAASKSGVEAVCNALRIELAHHGVTVGTMHPSWVATPMVAQGQELSAFRRLRQAMPPPLRRDLSLDQAAELLAVGLEQRRDRVFVPGWIRLLRWLRTPLHTRGAERDMRLAMPEIETAFLTDVAARGVAGASSSAGAA